MKWSDVPELWQACFETAWDGCLEGSNPIGALVADQAGVVVVRGKSAVRTSVSDTVVSHNEIAHAEINALLSLDNREHDKAKASRYTLYVTLEPCPLCFSAFYMSDVLSLRYAAADRFGGSTNLIGTTPYLSKKKRSVYGPVGYLGDVSIFMNVYRDLITGFPADDPVHAAFTEDYPRAVAAARHAVNDDSDKLMEEQSFSAVFDRIGGWLKTRD